MPADDPFADPRITLLGPQREPRVPKVAERLGLRGRRFAIITAGWRDRESEDELLTDLLGGNTVNLGLWSLMQRVWERDPELAEGDRRRRLIHTEMQELYLIGLEQAVVAIRRIREHNPRDERVVDMAVEDVLEVMRRMDARHLERVADLNHSFYARYEPQHRDAVVDGRFHVGRLVADCEAIAVTGGHVGVLMGALHLFNLAPALAAPPPVTDAGADGTPVLLRPVLAWGAGAMVLTERVLLFYDHAVSSPSVSELLMNGLGLTRGIVALPSPKERLAMRDPDRMSVLVRRAAPAHALLLDEQAEVTLTAGGHLPAGARILGPDGAVTTYAPPAPPARDGEASAREEESA
ncbi:hypothetical protein [Ornithinimicrobium pekingense]|uniref:Uncharacterized protein n=1 Tax=Ornithinimicrobium pekingense TaxID=384677 RepID=A0ABQ2F3D6_9MICO|nr:hypothetical protein [Ornithinimicrobium pekingense]GGK55738.1 hypothetical protein GCM10011509_00050 [Ornithinimicrobium pekingense]